MGETSAPEPGVTGSGDGLGTIGDVQFVKMFETLVRTLR